MEKSSLRKAEELCKCFICLKKQAHEDMVMRNSDIIKQVVTGKMDSWTFQHRSIQAMHRKKLSELWAWCELHETSGGVRPKPTFQLYPTSCHPTRVLFLSSSHLSWFLRISIDPQSCHLQFLYFRSTSCADSSPFSIHSPHHHQKELRLKMQFWSCVSPYYTTLRTLKLLCMVL